MASSSSSRMLFAAVAMFATVASATAADILVGGGDGWRPGSNYTAWAEGMDFRVGDRLVFNYTRGDHNVAEVDSSAFKACTVGVGAIVRDSGNDVVPLDTAGRKWFLCSKGDHCSRGQKLVIIVMPAITTQPSPPNSPPSPALSPPSFWPPLSTGNVISLSLHHYMVVTAAALAAMVVA